LNHDPPDLCLLNSWDYRHEPLAPSYIYIFFSGKDGQKNWRELLSSLSILGTWAGDFLLWVLVSICRVPRIDLTPCPAQATLRLLWPLHLFWEVLLAALRQALATAPKASWHPADSRPSRCCSEWNGPGFGEERENRLGTGWDLQDESILSSCG
jgi:hypothetical protein